MRYDPILPPRPARSTAMPPAALAACALLLGLALVLPDPALAADNIFGGRSPLQRFITFITGIFAYMLVIVGLIVTLGGLILGSDMSGFSRRAPLVVVAGSVLILADIMVGALFGAQGGYDLPASASLAPPYADIPAPAMMQAVSFPWARPDLGLDGPLGPGFAIVTGIGAVLVLAAGVVLTALGLRRGRPGSRFIQRGTVLVLGGVVLLTANMVANRMFGEIGGPPPPDMRPAPGISEQDG